MKISDVRNLFSKGTIAVGENGVSVIYTHRNGNGWGAVIQDTGDSNKRFQELILWCDRFIISYERARFVKIEFKHKFCGIIPSLFPPVKIPMSKEEFDELRNSLQMPASDRKVFDGIFEGVDQKDEDDMLERLGKWVDYVDRNEAPKEYELSDIKRWREMKSIASSLSKEFMCEEVLIEEPDDEYEGSIEFRIVSSKKLSVALDGEKKRAFANLAGYSNCVSFEIDVDNAFVNIIFLQ